MRQREERWFGRIKARLDRSLGLLQLLLRPFKLLLALCGLHLRLGCLLLLRLLCWPLLLRGLLLLWLLLLPLLRLLLLLLLLLLRLLRLLLSLLFAVCCCCCCCCCRCCCCYLVMVFSTRTSPSPR